MQELQHSHSSPQQLVQQAKKCSSSELSSNSLEEPSPWRAERIREGKPQKSPLMDSYQSFFQTKESLSVTVWERMRGQAVLNKSKEGIASTAAQVVQELLSQVYKTLIKEKNFGFSTISKYLFQF